MSNSTMEDAGRSRSSSPEYIPKSRSSSPKWPMVSSSEPDSEELNEQRRDHQRAHQELEDEQVMRAYYQESREEPLDLTLGVEIECILLQDTKKVPITNQLRPHNLAKAYNALYTALSAPLTGECAICHMQQSFRLLLNEPDVNDLPTGRQDYTKWTIIHDYSVKADEMQNEFAEECKTIKAHSIEIISRVLRAVPRSVVDGEKHECELSYDQEIKSVYQRLEAAFMSPTTDTNKLAWRLLDNESCGLHVHIGNGAGKRLPLKVLQNATMISIANERAIDNMQSVPRINGSTLITDPQRPLTQPLQEPWLIQRDHCLPWSAQFALRTHQDRNVGSTEFRNEAEEEMDRYPCFPYSHFAHHSDLKANATKNNILAWTRITSKATDIRHIIALHGSRGKQNLMNLSNMRPTYHPPRGLPPKNTIEFRQAGGALDHTSTNHWIHFLLTLINYSNTHSPDAVLATCTRIWRDEDYTTLDFLHGVLGYTKNSPVFQHYRSVLGLHRNPSPTRSYAHILYHREMSLATARSADGFYDLVKFNAERNLESRKPEAVRRAVHGKFMEGCYGQFEGEFVRTLGFERDWEVPRGEFQTRLVVGWVA